jgi:hypothetical protein
MTVDDLAVVSLKVHRSVPDPRLEQLTELRDSNLLAKIRSVALDSLIERASWRSPGHASKRQEVLGRVAGIHW